MKITFICLFVCVAQLFAVDTVAQNKVIELKSTKLSIEELFKEIESQTDYLVVYSTADVRSDANLSLGKKKAKVSELLNEAFSGKTLKYELKENYIIVSSVQSVQQTGRRVVGQVVDANGEPIIGANVLVKGTTNGVITDIDGNYALNDVPDNAIIQISYIGYQNVELKAGDKNLAKVTLAEDSELLDEVVVVGYGTQKKANLTGAVATVSQETLKDRPVASVGRALQGMIPNLNITVSSGQPGAGASYNIRGTTSPNGGDPLVLVDGIETNLDRINSNDIETITVLKDAASAAVYGARAAFGVILITTKSGEKNQKAEVSYSGYYSFSTPTTSTDFETRGYYSAKIADFFSISAYNSPYTSYTDEDYQALWERRNDKTENPARPWVKTVMRNGRQQYLYLANFDWYNYLYDDSRPTWDHNINIKGGNKDLSYMLSGRYYSQQGINRLNPDGFKSYNFRAKLQAEITPWLTISNNTKFFSSTYEYYGAEDDYYNFRMPTLHALASFVPVNPDGTAVMAHSMTNNAGHVLMDGWNVAQQKGKSVGHKRTQELSTTFELQFKLHRTFNVKADFSYTSGNLRNDYRGVDLQYSTYPGEIIDYSSKYFMDKYKEVVWDQKYYVADVYATYNNTFNEKHNVTVMAGYNYEAKYYKDLSASNTDLLSEDLSDFDLAVGTNNMSIEGGQNEYAIMGLFYRAAYDYKGKYLAEVNGRYDGSSRFPRGHRFGFFPSFSAGYRISEEAFFEPLRTTIDNLKLRFSYGSLGNQQIGYYDFIQTIDTGGTMSYSFDGTTKGKHATVSDPVSGDQTWEKVISKNWGIDLSMLNNRLTLTAEYYIRDTKGILGKGKSLPSIYGASEPQVNSNNLQTKGFELTLGWNDQFTLASHPFKYGVTASISKYSAEYTKCDNPSGLIGDPYVGKKYGEIWGYVIDGLFENDEVAAEYASRIDMSYVAPGCYASESAYGKGVRGGDPRYIDLNGDNAVTAGKGTLEDPGDRIVIGNTTPRFQYGINLNASWNGIDVSAFFQGIGRKDWYPDYENQRFWGAYSRPYQTFIPSNFMSDVWSEENPDAYFPRARAYATFNNGYGTVYYQNTRYLQNLAYCRLKNLTIGYTIPKSLLSKISINNCRVYVSGENLFTWTALRSDFLDPEQASAGTSGRANVYPWCKTFSFGVNLTF